MNFLEEEKKRLQDKVERMTQSGEMQNCSIILKMRKKSKMNCRLDLRKILKITYICKRRWINTQYAISALLQHYSHCRSVNLFLDKEMILELERMRALHGTCGKERSPSRLDAFVKSLEEERDHYRHEAEKYRKTRGGADSVSPSKSRSPRGRGSWPGRVRYPVHTRTQINNAAEH